jgi:hypothetical protein
MEELNKLKKLVEAADYLLFCLRSERLPSPYGDNHHLHIARAVAHYDNLRGQVKL